MASEQIAQTLYGPTDKERKYDRQLRLWATSGQAALEAANILLVNTGGGSLAIETLKNLVLPGVGSFTIVDDAIVEDVDLGVNFFLHEACLGKSRALCCRDYLVELNPGVKGDWFPKERETVDLKKLVTSSGPFTIILYTLPLKYQHANFLESYSKQHNIPLLVGNCSGFYAYFSLKLHKLLPVVDTHPDDSAMVDMRLLNPWPELSAFASRMTDNIEHQKDHDHGHIPLIAILLYYIEIWKLLHNGSVPKAYSDKIAFRALVAQGARTNNSEGGEENFDEAVAAVMKHISDSSLPKSLQEIFEHEQISKDNSSDSFWVIANAVKLFYRKHRQLPLPGRVPDMKTQSDVYFELQSIFKAKAKADFDEVVATIRNLPSGHQIKLDEVDLFCKNARFIKLLQDPKNEPNNHQVIQKELANDEMAVVSGPEVPFSLIPIFLVLQTSALNPLASAADLIKLITNFAPEFRGNQRLLQVAQEVSRSGRGELHNIASIIGGMIAQEMVKIITRQYVPIDNTCVFDGIESRCQVLRLNLSDNCSSSPIPVDNRA